MMKRISLFLAISTLFLICSPPAEGQTGAVAANRASRAAKKPAKKAQTIVAETDAWRRRFWFYATLSSSFDTNINHERQGLNSYGVVPSLGMHFQNSVEKPSFEMEYEIAAHRYTNTNEWNRVSQRFVASYKKHLFGRWSTRTEGEVTLKGSSEDRELNNQYALGQQLEYRLNQNSRVQLVAAYRLKRDPIDSGNNAIDPYLGAKFIQRLAGDRRLALSYRYDKNRSQDPKNRYIRWAYEAEFAMPIIDRRNRITFDLTFKPRLYARTVKVDGARVPRRDGRWIFETMFERSLRPDLKVSALYRFERRESNDPDKKFKSHQAGIALTYKW